MKSAAQSASSIEAFMLCPTRYYLRYIEKIEPIEATDALRMGTTWHKCLEILTLEPESNCSDCKGCSGNRQCSICGGTGVLPEDMRLALVRHLNQAYEHRPPSIEPEDWAIERVTLLNSALGWQWYWQDDAVETLAREIWFDTTITKQYRRVGVLDRLVRRGSQISLGEYKSTSKPIDSGSDYWKRLRGDPQLSLYLIEAQRLQEKGELSKHGITANDPPISGVLFDVWHKPQIKPKKLTQAESKQFLEDGKYCGQEFTIFHAHHENTGGVQVNGIVAELTPGKKDGTFAIRETPDMFGARLLSDITAQPEKYFARREVAREDRELEEADADFHVLARLIHLMTLRDLWYRNEYQCTATYRCPYFSICHHDLLPVVRQGLVPEGFKRKGK